MIQRPPYKEALGIATGDVVRTSYGTGPYYVWNIHGPRYTERGVGYFAVWPFPIVSLVLVRSIDGFPMSFPDSYSFSYINAVYLRVDGRWFSGQDEVFVTTPRMGQAQQMNLFAIAQELPPPYEFQPGVDYFGGDGTVWKCPTCEADFNAPKIEEHNPIHCGVLVSLLFITMGNDGDWRTVLQRYLRVPLT